MCCACVFARAHANAHVRGWARGNVRAYVFVCSCVGYVCSQVRTHDVCAGWCALVHIHVCCSS